MTNSVSEGKTLNIIAPSGGLASGQAILVGLLLAVVVAAVLEGETAVGYIDGCYELPKATGAVTQGVRLYWDDTAKKLTTTASGNTLAGFAADAAASGDGTVKIILKGGLGASTPGTATTVAALGTTTDFTAIGATFADLAAARAAVNTLKNEAETRTDAIEAKVDAVIAALKAAGLMATS